MGLITICAAAAVAVSSIAAANTQIPPDVLGGSENSQGPGAIAGVLAAFTIADPALFGPLIANVRPVRPAPTPRCSDY